MIVTVAPPAFNADGWVADIMDKIRDLHRHLRASPGWFNLSIRYGTDTNYPPYPHAVHRQAGCGAGCKALNSHPS